MIGFFYQQTNDTVVDNIPPKPHPHPQPDPPFTDLPSDLLSHLLYPKFRAIGRNETQCILTSFLPSSYSFSDFSTPLRDGFEGLEVELLRQAFEWLEQVLKDMMDSLEPCGVCALALEEFESYTWEVLIYFEIKHDEIYCNSKNCHLQISKIITSLESGDYATAGYYILALTYSEPYYPYDPAAPTKRIFSA